MKNEHSKSIFYGSKCDADRKKDSFVSMSIDEFFDTITSEEFSTTQDDIEYYRGKGNEQTARALESALPIFFPSADFANMPKNNTVVHNGMMVFTMKGYNIENKLDAMNHLQVWKFVKGYYRNIRGNIVIFAWMGYCKDKKELLERRKNVLELMSAALPKMKFDCRRRLIRGVMMCHDSIWAFWREDSEVEAPPQPSPKGREEGCARGSSSLRG